MIVHDSWWSNDSAHSTIIVYHVTFDQGLTLVSCLATSRIHYSIVYGVAFTICLLALNVVRDRVHAWAVVSVLPY